MERLFTSFYVEDPDVDREFFVRWLGFQVAFDSDWFVHLRAGSSPSLEVGLIAYCHDTVPDAFRRPVGGAQLTIVVQDQARSFESAQELGLDIVEAPRDMFYGQRRMLVRSPGGILVDISASCSPDPAWLAKLSSVDGVYTEKSTASE